MWLEAARPRVAVALSGGVDSAAAAALLKREGFEVLALTMRLFSPGDGGEEGIESAQAVARALGVEHEFVDVTAEFERLVIEPFLDAYVHGTTPNPCVTCNRFIKFGSLLDAALERGCEFLATGHYARLEGGAGGPVRLFRGADPGKDQSYVLWTLGQETLGSLLFPLGRLTKDAARALAREAGDVRTSPESQDICFLAGGSLAGLFEQRASGLVRPGPVLDTSGNIIGTHRGLPFYTVGQRRGLGLGGPKAMFVLELRGEDNALVVGSAAALACNEFRVVGLNFISGETPTGTLSCLAQTRYRGPALPATLEVLEGSSAVVRYAKPGPAAAPGQSAAFYLDGELVGGGVIARDKPEFPLDSTPGGSPTMKAGG